MSLEMWITLAILAAAIALFVTERLRVDVVAICVLLALMLTGVLTTEEALAGFSSPSVLSIAFLFIVGGAVFQTGLAAVIGDRILKVAGANETRLLVMLMVTIAVMSAFISSTGVVALMLPAVISLARSTKIPTSRLLMPMAFSALLGGSATLIGTPPNIIVSETLQRAGYAPFDFFSFTAPGVLLILAGLGFMLTVGRRLLPERKTEQTIQRMETPAELFELYRLPDNLFRLRVPRQSPLIGMTVGESGLGRDFNISIVSITHNNSAASASEPRNGTTRHNPPVDTVFQQDDVLVVRGDISDITDAAGHWKLGIMANHPVREGDVITNEVGIAEVILRPRSSLNGKTLQDVRFGSTYHLTVLSLRRPGVDEPLDTKETPLKFGDVMLIQGRWRDIFALKRLRHDFIVMGEPEAAEMGAFTRKSHAPVTLVILIVMIVAIALNLMPLTLASMLAGMAIVLTGCLTMDEAYDSIDWKSLFLIAGMLPMSTALVKVGLVDLAANALVATLGAWGPLFVLAGLFILTSTFTQVLSNTATALLIAPIALASAQGLRVDPHAFLMAVAIAASMAFASPVASPVNTLVMSAGNYRFSDYARVGALMVAISFVMTLIVLPVLWPF
jgi:di/tricarboxylate transporter